MLHADGQSGSTLTGALARVHARYGDIPSLPVFGFGSRGYPPMGIHEQCINNFVTFFWRGYGRGWLRNPFARVFLKTTNGFKHYRSRWNTSNLACSAFSVRLWATTNLTTLGWPCDASEGMLSRRSHVWLMELLLKRRQKEIFRKKKTPYRKIRSLKISRYRATSWTSPVEKSQADL